MYPNESQPPADTFNESDAQKYAILALKARAASAAGLFLLIVGLSVVNTLLAVLHIPLGMAFGLGLTQILDALGSHNGFHPLYFVLELIPLGFFALMALLARKYWVWLIVGMVFYLIDGAIAVWAQLWIDSLVHGYVLFRLYQGVAAALAARNLETMAQPR